MRLYEIHRGMYQVAADLLKPGNRVEDIAVAVREYARKQDPDRFVNERTGMLQITEDSDVGLTPYTGELKPGMAWVLHGHTTDRSVRPGHTGGTIYGHVIGDSYIITETGAECVSKLPFELSIV